MISGHQSSIIHASVDIQIDIQVGISMKGQSTMDVRGSRVSTKEYPCFMDISLLLNMLLRVSI